MKKVVIDASVAVKWQLDDEEHVDKADVIKKEFNEGRLLLIVPVIFPVEWANAINIAILHGRFPEEEWEDALKDFEARDITVLNLPGLLYSAWVLARKYKQSLYDCLYLSLAQHEGCQMVTGDLKLCQV